MRRCTDAQKIRNQAGQFKWHSSNKLSSWSAIARGFARDWYFSPRDRPPQPLFGIGTKLRVSSLPLAASPNRWHRGSPSCVRGVHDSIVLAPDGAFRHRARVFSLLAGGFQYLPSAPQTVSNIAPSNFPSLLPQPAADQPFGQQSQLLRVTTNWRCSTGTRLGTSTSATPQPTSFFIARRIPAIL